MMDTTTAATVRRWMPLAAAVVSVIAIALLPDIQDYQDYGRQWTQLLQGGNPWFDGAGHWNGNAYGPLHTLLAGPFWLWHKLPRVLLAVAWVSVGLLFFREAAPGSESPRWAHILLFWASPYLWAEVVLYSHTDLFVAALCLAALVTAERDRPVLSGILLACGVSLKLYPLALIPFFLFRERRLQRRWMLSAVSTVVVIYGAAWLLWGSTVWESVTVAMDRGSSPFSVFFFLRSVGADVDWLSVPLLVLCGGAFWLLYLARRVPLGLGVVTAFCLVLSLYKVGHEQFEMFLYLGVLLLWWRAPIRIPRLLRGAIWTYWAWAGFRALSSTVLSHLHVFSPIRWAFSAPNFAVLVLLLVALLRWTGTDREAGALSLSS